MTLKENIDLNPYFYYPGDYWKKKPANIAGFQ
jgi:hypothetical protein